MNDDFVYNNEDESGMGQLHAMHLNFNAIAKVRAAIGTGISLVDCTICGEKIPEARRVAVQGCTHCIDCKTKIEQRR